MRKVLALCFLAVLAFFVLVCGDGQTGTEAQEQVGALPNYGFESDVMPISEIGRVFEQMGREMQQNGNATFLGITYPMDETAHIELYLNRREIGDRGLRTNFGVEFGTGERMGRPEGSEAQAQTYYQGRLASGTPAEVADALDQFAETLATTGAFAWDFHSGDFVGSAIVDQYLGQATRGPREVHRYTMDITFGEGEVQRHDDREDMDEGVEEGTSVILGTSSEEAVDQATVVEALRGLSSGLRASEITVGEGRAPIEIDDVRLGWAHVFVPGGSDKVELNLQWSNTPPPEPEPEAEGPARYHDEPSNMPRAEFAEMLQRIATEILEDGTFMFNGEEYTVGETIGGEIFFSANGMSFEVGWRR